jgi:hypothetical protein
MKAVNVNINEHSNKKNISTEVAYVFKNHTAMKTIKKPITINIKKKCNSSESANKLSSLKKYETVKMTKKFLDSNLDHHLFNKETFDLSVNDKESSQQQNLTKSRSRSISKSKFNLYYCKHKSKALKRSTSYENSCLRNNIISCNYRKSMSSDKTFKISYSERNSISPEINLSPKRFSKLSQDSQSKSKFQSKRLMLGYSLMQKHYDHYTDILHEVKKILRKDVSSKRKLKYIFKKQQIYMHAPYIKLRSSTDKEFCILENDIKRRNIKNQMNLNTLECFHSCLSTKNHKNFRKICISPVKSIIQESKVLCTKTNLFNENLGSSAFISNIDTQPNIIDRDLSPVHSLEKEKEIHNNIGKTKLHKLSLVSKINVSGNSSKYDLKLCDDFEKTDMFSKYFNIEKDSLNTSNSTYKSSNILSNSFLSENSKDIKFSKKKDLNVKETFSFFQLSSSSQSTSFTQALTPLKNCTNSNSWPQIFVLQNNASNLVLKEDIQYSKTNEEEIMTTHQPTLKTSPVSEFSKSQVSHLKRCFQNFDSNYSTRSRSISFSKTSKSLSRSISSDSEDIRKRSRSKSSNHTCIRYDKKF